MPGPVQPSEPVSVDFGRLRRLPNPQSQDEAALREMHHRLVAAQAQNRSLQAALEQEQTKSNVAEARLSSLERQLSARFPPSGAFNLTLQKYEADVAVVEAHAARVFSEDSDRRQKELRSELAVALEKASKMSNLAEQEADLRRRSAETMRAAQVARDREVEELQGKVSHFSSQCQQHKMHLQVSQEEHSKTLEAFKTRGMELEKARSKAEAYEQRLEGLRSELTTVQDNWMRASTDTSKLRKSADDAVQQLAECQQLNLQRSVAFQAQESALEKAMSRLAIVESELHVEQQEKSKLQDALRTASAATTQVRESGSAELSQVYLQHAQELAELREQQASEFSRLRREHTEEKAALQSSHAGGLRTVRDEWLRMRRSLTHEDRSKTAETLVKQLTEALQQSEGDLKMQESQRMSASLSGDKLEDLYLLLRCRDEELYLHRQEIQKKESDIAEMARMLEEAKVQLKAMERITHSQEEIQQTTTTTKGKLAGDSQQSIRGSRDFSTPYKEALVGETAKQPAVLRTTADATDLCKAKSSPVAATASFQRSKSARRASSMSPERRAVSAPVRRFGRMANREAYVEKLKAAIESELGILHKYSHELDEYVRFRREARSSCYDTLAFEDMVAERLHGLAGQVEGRILKGLRDLQHPN